MNNPTPQEVKARRLEANLTQTQASNLVHSKLRSWQRWESGDRTMHPAFWELFLIKLKNI